MALDPVLGKSFKNYDAKLTVVSFFCDFVCFKENQVAESIDVTLFSLPNNLFQYVPDYIKVSKTNLMEI